MSAIKQQESEIMILGCMEDLLKGWQVNVLYMTNPTFSKWTTIELPSGGVLFKFFANMKADELGLVSYVFTQICGIKLVKYIHKEKVWRVCAPLPDDGGNFCFPFVVGNCIVLANTKGELFVYNTSFNRWCKSKLDKFAVVPGFYPDLYARNGNITYVGMPDGMIYGMTARGCQLKVKCTIPGVKLPDVDVYDCVEGQEPKLVRTAPGVRPERGSESLCFAKDHLYFFTYSGVFKYDLVAGKEWVKTQIDVGNPQRAATIDDDTIISIAYDGTVYHMLITTDEAIRVNKIERVAFHHIEAL